MRLSVVRMRHRFKLRSQRGLESVETGFVIVLVIGTLVGLIPYLQRGLQGRHKSTADMVGQKFDPRDKWSSDRSNAVLDVIAKIAVGARPNAGVFQPQTPKTPFAWGVAGLTDTPTGAVPREPIAFSATSRSDWTSDTDMWYCDAKTDPGCDAY